MMNPTSNNVICTERDGGVRGKELRAFVVPVSTFHGGSRRGQETKADMKVINSAPGTQRSRSDRSEPGAGRRNNYNITILLLDI